jgi:hypothetical protein
MIIMNPLTVFPGLVTAILPRSLFPMCVSTTTTANSTAANNKASMPVYGTQVPCAAASSAASPMSDVGSRLRACGMPVGHLVVMDAHANRVVEAEFVRIDFAIHEEAVDEREEGHEPGQRSDAPLGGSRLRG